MVVMMVVRTEHKEELERVSLLEQYWAFLLELKKVVQMVDGWENG